MHEVVNPTLPKSGFTIPISYEEILRGGVIKVLGGPLPPKPQVLIDRPIRKRSSKVPLQAPESDSSIAS